MDAGLDVEMFVSVVHSKLLVALRACVVLEIVQRSRLDGFEGTVGLGGSIAGDAVQELAAGCNARARQPLARHA
eukprot:6200168-Pleurochrysis_carterae.AAC.7